MEFGGGSATEALGLSPTFQLGPPEFLTPTTEQVGGSVSSFSFFIILNVIASCTIDWIKIYSSFFHETGWLSVWWFQAPESTVAGTILPPLHGRAAPKNCLGTTVLNLFWDSFYQLSRELFVTSTWPSPFRDQSWIGSVIPHNQEPQFQQKSLNGLSILKGGILRTRRSLISGVSLVNSPGLKGRAHFQKSLLSRWSSGSSSS